MPREDNYKEMYEMGERLMEMAKSGGYNPDEAEDSEESDDYEDSDMEASNNSGSKIKSALNLFSK